MSQVYQAFTGTAKDFISKGVKINGQIVDQVGLCILSRYGAVKVVGKGDKPARGKTPAIFKAQGKSGFVVEC